MRYLPKSPGERIEMLKQIGAGSIDDLFSTIPQEYRLERDLDVPRQMGESEIVEYFRNASQKSAAGYTSFLGAGAYRHYRPVIIDSLVQRGEFLTSYTPYQAEITQGTLQAIFEFQTMICELTGMEIANASMYDGSTGAAESVTMAVRITHRSGVSGRQNRASRVSRGDADLRAAPGACRPDARLRRRWAARPGRAGTKRHRRNCLRAGAVTELFRGHRRYSRHRRDRSQERRAADCLHRRGHFAGRGAASGEADIVSMEAQSFGVALSYGGPYCGVIAAKEKYLRQMPGRLVGETVDKEGRRGFVLTLSTREQHIRREKATSNICTNQALVALMATIFLTVYGKEGIRELALHNLAKANYAAKAVFQRRRRPAALRRVSALP
jgi:glycine dehydrogenase subunit 1